MSTLLAGSADNNLHVLAWLVGCGLDAASTHYGLRHGATEVLLTQSPWVNDGLIAGQAMLGSIASIWVAKWYPRVALALSTILVVSRTAIAVHNILRS